MSLSSIKKISSLLLCSCFICCILMGCGAFSNQDKMAKVGKPLERPEEYLPIDKNKLHQLGETVLTLYPDKPGSPYASMEYTMKTAVLYEQPEDAGIDMNQVLVTGDLVYDLETGIPETAPDVSKLSFLLVDVVIRNPGREYQNITELDVVCRMDEEGKLGWTGYPAYFSMPEEARDELDAYNYHLPVNESMEAWVGWWIDMEQCRKKENLYLALNHGSEEGLGIEAYWELNL